MGIEKLLGLTVCDQRHTNIGIIVGIRDEAPGEVYVRQWVPSVQQYLDFPKHWKTLLEMPHADNWLNENDLDYWERLKAAGLEMAVETKDKEWFDELQQIAVRQQ